MNRPIIYVALHFSTVMEYVIFITNLTDFRIKIKKSFSVSKIPLFLPIFRFHDPKIMNEKLKNRIKIISFLKYLFKFQWKAFFMLIFYME